MPVEYLCYAGVEVANNLRTLSYLRAGLAGCWEIALCDNPFPDGHFVTGDFYVDTYVDVYGEDTVFIPSNPTQDLCCYCEAIDEGPYVDPMTDDAPWYDPLQARSADFLGLLISELSFGEAPISRTITSLSGGGSLLGGEYLSHRIVTVQGTLFAASHSGMAYGKAWLAEVLRGGICGQLCSADEAIVLPACPEDWEDADRAFRKLVDVGLISFPPPRRFATNTSEAEMLEVEFQFAAGRPYLYAPAEACITELSISGRQSRSCVASTSEWMGDATFVLTVESLGPHPIRNMQITLTPTFSGICPQDDRQPCFDVLVDILYPGAILVIDGLRNQVRQYDPTRKVWLGGMSNLIFPGVFVWPEMGACSEMCIKFLGGAGNAKVSADKYDRELA